MGTRPFPAIALIALFALNVPLSMTRELRGEGLLPPLEVFGAAAPPRRPPSIPCFRFLCEE